MLNVCQQVGGTIGLSALVTVFSTAARHSARGQRHVLQGQALAQAAVQSTHGADMAFGPVRRSRLFALRRARPLLAC